MFAASGGLAEVLISPVIAAIPSDRPESEMSKLHSVYAWGVVGVVFLSTGFLAAFWQGKLEMADLDLGSGSFDCQYSVSEGQNSGTEYAFRNLKCVETGCRKAFPDLLFLHFFGRRQ